MLSTLFFAYQTLKKPIFYVQKMAKSPFMPVK